MTYQTRTILRRALPIAFWLLALGVSISLPFILSPFNFHLSPFNFHLSPFNYYTGFISAFLLLLAIFAMSHLDRHESSARETFQMAVLLGVASYWVPTILFATIPFWIFAMTRYAFSFRAFLASLLGFALVAVHAALFIVFGWIDNVWADFFAPERLWGWIPVSACFLAWFGTTIVRKNLRER